MNVSRRSFLGGVASFGATWGLRAFAAPPGLFSSGCPQLTFGAISDIHISSPASKVKVGTKLFEHALGWYRAQGVELGAASAAARGSSCCVLARDTLPSGKLTFRVFPGECFGRLGRPLVGTWEG